MSTDTEARRAAVERVAEKIEELTDHLGDSRRIALWAIDSIREPRRAEIGIGDLREMMYAAQGKIEAEDDGDEGPKAADEPSRCIYCGGRITVYTQYTLTGRVCRAACLNSSCNTQGPKESSSERAIARFLAPGASKPEPPPREVPIGNGTIRIAVDLAGAAFVAAYPPGPAVASLFRDPTADQLDSLAALASRVAAEVRAKGGGL